MGNKLEKNKEYLTKEYDGIVYPPIENTPKKVAILVRNEWIVRQSDVIIAYVGRTFGGAYKAVAYAKKRGKKL